MRKYLFIITFVVGLGIFLYPTISNIFATTAHQTTIKSYEETIEQMDAHAMKEEKKRIENHNDELAESDLNFVDPFSDNKEEEESGNKSYYDALNIAPAIGSVEIPKLNVELPIYHGTSDDVLSRGAGHLENSSLPSSKSGTHSVVTAHRGLPSSKLFRDLDELTIGDQFYVQVLDETIAYEIDSVDIVLPSETEWLTMNEDENKMTLLTCDPYMVNTHRMLVTGHQVPYDPDSIEEIVQNNDHILYFIVGLLLVLLLIIFLLRRNKQKKGEV